MSVGRNSFFIRVAFYAVIPLKVESLARSAKWIASGQNACFRGINDENTLHAEYFLALSMHA